jgi:hypothetical protein
MVAWLQENSEALSRLQRLSQLLPASLGLEALVAQAHYNLQNYDEAQVREGLACTPLAPLIIQGYVERVNVSHNLSKAQRVEQ